MLWTWHLLVILYNSLLLKHLVVVTSSTFPLQPSSAQTQRPALRGWLRCQGRGQCLATPGGAGSNTATLASGGCHTGEATGIVGLKRSAFKYEAWKYIIFQRFGRKTQIAFGFLNDILWWWGLNIPLENWCQWSWLVCVVCENRPQGQFNKLAEGCSLTPAMSCLRIRVWLQL